jgi:hypothetical protein
LYATTLSGSRPTSAMGPPHLTDFLSLPAQMIPAKKITSDQLFLDQNPLDHYTPFRTTSIYPNLNKMDLRSLQFFEKMHTLPLVPTPPSPQDPVCGTWDPLMRVKVPRPFSPKPELNPLATEDPWSRPIQQKYNHGLKVQLTWVKFARKYLQEEAEKVRFSKEMLD